jgi:DNA-binding transcriptional LysR family regulator
MSLTAALRDLNKLNTFVRVGERRSFTRAAADLRTTPSVVSNRIKELEEALGFSLMNRSTHGVVLTEAGEGLLQNCLQLLARLDDYVVEARNLQTGPFGTLRVQAPSDYAGRVLAPLVKKFVTGAPGLHVHLFAVEENSTSGEDGFDVIIAGKKPSPPGLTGRDLGEIRHVICGAPGYFRRCGRPSEPKDLRQHNCLTGQFSGAKEWPFKAGSRPFLVAVKGSLSSNSHAALAQMAVQGCGIIRVPRYAVQAELKSKALEPIFEGVALSPERLFAYFSKARLLPAKTTEFIQFLQATLAAR